MPAVNQLPLNPTPADVARHIVADHGNAVRNALLLVLTEWADSEEGVEYRADRAALSEPAAMTAEDVLSMMDEAEATEMRKTLSTL